MESDLAPAQMRILININIEKKIFRRKRMEENDPKTLPEEKIETKENGDAAVKPKEEEAVGSKLVTPIFSQPVAVIIRSGRL
jgi:hypothetical protein